jgi:hypothetical protein
MHFTQRRVAALSLRCVPEKLGGGLSLPHVAQRSGCDDIVEPRATEGALCEISVCAVHKRAARRRCLRVA